MNRSAPPPAPPGHDAEAAADEQEVAAPACVMSFNASEPSGAGGTAGDVATIAAMGAHALPVVSCLLLRDTAEVFDQHLIESEVIVDQARGILEDIPVAAWKVGYLGSAEGISAVAEVLSDYPDVPLVAYLPATPWLDEEQQVSYLDAFRELILPQTLVLVGNHKTLSDFLLPDWDADRPASPRELAVAAAQHGAAHVLVTGIGLSNQYIDNVLANAQGPICGEKFERFDVGFVGAGDTLSASLTALLSVGTEVHTAVGESLAFLDQALDAGFRPGMGQVVPDRFFWALPPGEEGEAAEPDDEPPAGNAPARRIH